MLMNAAEISTCPKRNKYVLLLVDEMHIKENLIIQQVFWRVGWVCKSGRCE